MDMDLQYEIEDCLSEHNVFVNGLTGKPAHSDSYMTVVDFENLDKAINENDYNWLEFAEHIKQDPNIQIPMKIVCSWIVGTQQG